MCPPLPAKPTVEEELRRKRVVAEKKTDLERWRNPQNLDPTWGLRAQFVARFVPPQVSLLDLGCGAMEIERFLPLGTVYIPCDVVPRDERTLVCDFNKEGVPRISGVGAVTVLGVLEYIQDAPSFIRSLRVYEVPVLISYCPTDLTSHLDREAQGWVNHFSLALLSQLIESSGFAITRCEHIDEVQMLFCLEPTQVSLVRN
jgi:hypothetical protein